MHAMEENALIRGGRQAVRLLSLPLHLHTRTQTDPEHTSHSFYATLAVHRSLHLPVPSVPPP